MTRGRILALTLATHGLVACTLLSDLSGLTGGSAVVDASVVDAAVESAGAPGTRGRAD